MSKNRKQHNVGSAIALILVGLTGLALLIGLLLQGNNVALFNPKGAIAKAQLDLMLLSFGIMMVIAVPTLFLIYYFAWKYRESNTKAIHAPNTRHGKFFNATIWLVPAVFAIVLGVIMWSATHKLEPQKEIAADTKPLTIQVIAQRWKWLFIYPEQGIATVNYLQLPANTPVTFELTADEAPMSSFWIPNLGGMLYAMTGHVNRLNLIAETPGEYPGSTGEINGAGFAGMKFTARVGSPNDFEEWVRSVKQHTTVLNSTEYENLVKPSENNPPASYAAIEGSLYDTVVMKYQKAGHGDHPPAEHHGGH
jgi:cytochrome o ubiquinol oxidase subunit II